MQGIHQPCSQGIQGIQGIDQPCSQGIQGIQEIDQPCSQIAVECPNIVQVGSLLAGTRLLIPFTKIVKQ